MKIAIVAFSLISVLAGIKPRAAALSTVCYGPDDYTDFQIDRLKGVTASSAPKVVQFRANVHLPVVADTAIQVVADSTQCSRALATYNEDINTGGAPATGLYLIRAGNVFIGSNPRINTGREWTEQLVMDSAFVLVATYVR